MRSNPAALPSAFLQIFAVLMSTLVVPAIGHASETDGTALNFAIRILQKSTQTEIALATDKDADGPYQGVKFSGNGLVLKGPEAVALAFMANFFRESGIPSIDADGNEKSEPMDAARARAILIPKIMTVGSLRGIESVGRSTIWTDEAIIFIEKKGARIFVNAFAKAAKIPVYQTDLGAEIYRGDLDFGPTYAFFRKSPR